MKFGDKSDEVRNVQSRLVKAGYPLPKFGADGKLGNETWDALARFAAERGLTMSPPVVSAAVLAALAAPSQPAVMATDRVPIYDLRSIQRDPPFNQNHKCNVGLDQHGKALLRDPATVTGIVVHQTAIDFGLADFQLAAAGGDRRLALARRSLDVRCHVMAFHDGFVAWPNELRWWVHHGNGFNRSTLGIEIEGDYPEMIGGRTWDGKPATPVTDAVVAAARAGIHLLVTEGAKLGMPIRHIYAHRQSTNKPHDPGQELWQRVVLEYAVAKLGLAIHPKEILGDGQPLPTAWTTVAASPC